jgi:hypothetical protein
MQVRSPEERKQTIELPTVGLSTLDFTPPVDIIKKSVNNSAQKVLNYFEKGVQTEVIKQVLAEIDKT